MELFNVKPKKKKIIKEGPSWVDPMTPLERWFFNLPNASIREKCLCGSGKPVLYWSPDDGDGCEDCEGSMFVYIPVATMWNIVHKFGNSGEQAWEEYEESIDTPPHDENHYRYHTPNSPMETCAWCIYLNWYADDDKEKKIFLAGYKAAMKQFQDVGVGEK